MTPRKRPGFVIQQLSGLRPTTTNRPRKQLLRLLRSHPVLGASRLEPRRPLRCTAATDGAARDVVQGTIHPDSTPKHARTRHRHAQPNVIADATQRLTARSQLRPRLDNPLRSFPVTRRNQLVGNLTGRSLRQRATTERQIRDRIQRHIAYEADSAVPPLAQINVLVTENVAKPVMGFHLVHPIRPRKPLPLYEVHALLDSGHHRRTAQINSGKSLPDGTSQQVLEEPLVSVEARIV